jgi:quercetin dioxygenase-like cupin family protein
MKFYKAEQYGDERGIISNATPDNPLIRNVMYITGNKGAVRGNHVHKLDEHYCLVVSGYINFKWKDKNSDEVMSQLLYPGDVVLSEAGEHHKFIFETDGAFIAMATLPRTHENYEEDTTREDF